MKLFNGVMYVDIPYNLYSKAYTPNRVCVCVCGIIDEDWLKLVVNATGFICFM